MPRGAYHFYYFCRTPAEQAAWFMNHVPRDRSALPPVLDIEWNHQSRTCRRFPDPETVRAEARSFLQLLTAYYGKRPLIYTTVDFYRDNELWKLDGHHFWLRSVAGHPAEVYPGQRWAFWQYTGHRRRRGHRRPDRPQRLRGRPRPVGGMDGRRPELTPLPRAPGSV